MQPLIFFQTQIDHYSTSTDAVIHIHGITTTGPIRLHVHNFNPYFYVDSPTPSTDTQITTKLKQHSVTKTEVVQKFNLYGYTEKKTRLLKVFFANTTSMAAATRALSVPIFESNINYVMRFMIDNGIVGMSYLSVKKYELEKDGYHCSYLDIKQFDVTDGEYALLPNFKIVSFDIECVSVGFPNPQNDPVIQIGNVIDWTRNTTMKKDDNQIKDNTDTVSNNSDSVELNNSKNVAEKIQKSVIFCLRETSKIANTVVNWYDKEGDMLSEWAKFIEYEDPDIIIGFNVKNFDFPYLLDRAARLDIKSFPFLGRSARKVTYRSNSATNQKEVELEGRLLFDVYQIIKKEHKLRSYSLNSVSIAMLNEQKEDVPYYEISNLFNKNPDTRKRIASYCIKDCLLSLRLFVHLNILLNYTELSRVCGLPIDYISTRGQSIKVLSLIYRACKDYVVPTIDITEGTSYEGGFVMDPLKGYYKNPIAVLDFSSLYPSIMISKNLCYTTLILGGKKNLVVNSGNSKVVEHDKIGENIKVSENNKASENNEVNGDNSSKYIQNESYASEDVEMSKKKKNSYSSIGYENDSMDEDENEDKSIKIHNYTVTDDNSIIKDVMLIDKCVQTPTNNYFVKKEVKVGLLPKILMYLLDNRKKTKQEMKFEKNAEIKNCLNARQTAFKLAANSIYGFTGSALGRLPCYEISQSTTAFGRNMIIETKKIVEEFGKDGGCVVIYGDTDSVMIDMKTDDIKMVEEKGKQISELVSSYFEKPVSLEFEKIYFPFLLINKKRYAGLIHGGKIDMKGIETVRRDNCELVKIVVEKCLDLIMYEKNVEKAKEYVKKTIEDIYMDRIDMSKLVISKSISKSNYASKQAHVELAAKLRKRNNAEIGLGDRVPYVIVKGEGRFYEKAEDPIYVLENKTPIDTNYYIEHQLSKPIHRLFEPIMDNVSELFSGSHTRVQMGGSANGPLSVFGKKTEVCLNCKAKGEILCKRCRVDFKKVFLNLQTNLEEKKKVYGVCWSECQRCIANVTSEVLCVNRDCPIFYKRMKAKKELESGNDILEKLRCFEW